MTGSWLPLWSHGFKVCLHPPLTDESRIALSEGDLVNVTRWRKYWLFGEKIQDLSAITKENGNKSESDEIIKQRVRGWFPRRAAVENYDEDDDSEDENENNLVENKKIK